MKNKPDIAGYTLAKKISFDDISHIQKDLADLLEREAKRYEIDVSGVSAIDAAGLQLLIVFAKEVKSNNAEIVWKNPTPFFRDSVSSLDLEKRIEL